MKHKMQRNSPVIIKWLVKSAPLPKAEKYDDGSSLLGFEVGFMLVKLKSK